jgi:hypothetical protein
MNNLQNLRKNAIFVFKNCCIPKKDELFLFAMMKYGYRIQGLSRVRSGLLPGTQA